MRESDFNDDSPGRLVSADSLDGSYWPAFVPDPLPPQLEWSDETVGLLSQADRLLSLLNGRASGLPSSCLLIRPLTTREAVASSRIEGTTSDIPELYRFQLDGTAPDRDDAEEVDNHVTAMQLGLERLQQLPMSLRLIRDVHRELMSGARGGNRRPGEFRTSQVVIGGRRGIQGARYVPPPLREMTPAIHALEEFMNSDSPLPPLVLAALLHYQFEAIHPFEDGNGRTGRLLITLLLCQRGYLDIPCLYLSDYFARYRQEYLDLLLGISLWGEWDSWLRFFLAGVAFVAGDALARVEKLDRIRVNFQGRIREHRMAGAEFQLIESLFEQPYVTSARVQNVLGVSHTAAQGYLSRLTDVEILEPLPGRRRPQLYVAQGILNAIAEDPDFRDF